MKTNHKFMLSLATIAILSGTNAVAAELKVDNGALKLDNETIQVNGSASVAPAEGKEKEAIEVKSTIPSTLGGATMTDLTIKAPQAELKVGGGSAGGSLGGTAPAQDGAASNDGYGFTIDASKVSLNGKDTSNKAELNVNADSSITTSDTAGTSVGANSAINIANGKTLTIKGNLTTSDTSSTISINGGSLNLSGDLTATNGTISLGKDGSLTTNGALNANGGTLSLGGGTLTANGELKQGSGTISLGGGTLTANGKATLSADNNKLDLSQGGTLNFNGAGAENASTISGAVSSAKDKALNINLGRNSQLTFSDSLTLTNASDTALDKISLGGGVLEVKKLIADISNLDTQAGGTINFTGDGSKFTSNPNDTLTLGSGTTFNFKGEQGTEKTTFDNSLTTNGGKLSFNNATMNVKNLTTSANDLLFDSKNGGTIELANGGNSTINGNLTLGDKANIKIISAAGANAKAGTLNVGSLSATKTGNIALGGGTLNVAQGLIIANAGATPDSAGNQSNIDISKGGTINFNGGNSFIGGELKTTKDALLNVKAGNVVFEKLSFGDTTTADSTSKLTLDGGVVNVNELTTKDKANLALKSGTLNFNGKTNEDGTKADATSTIKELNLENSSANINFNEKANVTISTALDLTKDSSAVLNFNNGSTTTLTETNLDLTNSKVGLNFNSGSLVKIGADSKGTLTTAAGNNLNLGGQIELGKLVSKASAQSALANVNFGSAGVSLSGNLVGKDNNAKFTIGTDADGNSIIGASGEKVEIGEANTNSALTLKSGTVTTNAALTTATDSKLIFNGGSLNVGAGGTLTIADTSKNLELKDGAGGVITLKGDGTKGGSMTITTGALDLSKTSLGIKIENGGKLITTAASKISGNGNTIALSDYTGIRVYGDITTAAAGTFEYNKMGDLTLGKETTLGIITLANADGDLQEITAGKLSTTDGNNGFNTATLAFGNGGLVNLKGSVSDTTALKLNNAGFGSGLTLAENSVLEFAGGSVDVKGALGVEKDKTATLKVSNAVANLNGGFATTDYVKTIELDSGALNIKQDKLTATGLDITHIQRNAGGISSVMNIDGEATITGSKFAILPMVETGATSYKVLSTTKGLTQSGNTGEFRTRNSLNAILGKYGLSVDTSKIKDGDKVIDTKDSSVNAWLRDDGKNLFLERTLDVSKLSQVKADSIQADIDALTEMNKDKDIVGADSTNQGQANANVLDSVIDNLKAQQTAAASQGSKELASELGGGGANSDILLSAFGVSSGAIDTSTRNAIALDIMKNGGAGIVQDIKDGASSAANMSSSTSSIMNTMNLSNDMAISGRIAQANNPYGNLAAGFAGYEYAAVSGDLPLYYANNGYKNGFWANAIGGLNRVEGESGILMGLSAGFDRQLENTLVGFYLSYAMANLNDKVVEQSADNIQVGVYTSFNQRDIEVNVKAYGQLAVTETTAKRGSEGEATAKFNRLYGGLSANIGTIFALNNNSTFIKPFVGENYYYAHTPAYEETRDSVTALSVKSANNHALSFDVGVDVRQYWSENSFVYLTPSVERYVVNSGGDYTAGFLGSDTTFTIEGKSKTKTYGQVLLGGNIALSDKFNINVGLGAKKILAGQITRDNGDKIDELYLSGNLGVKYRF